MIVLSIIGGIILAVLIIGVFSNRRSYGYENLYLSSAGDRVRKKNANTETE